MKTYELSMRCGDNSDDGDHEVWIGIEDGIEMTKSKSCVFHTIREIDLKEKYHNSLDLLITKSNQQLSNKSFEDLMKWAGTLNLIMEHLNRLKSVERIQPDDIEGKYLEICEDLIDLLHDKDQMFNDLYFFKDLYNRLIEQSIKR